MAQGLTDEEKVAVLQEYTAQCNGTEDYHQYNTFVASALLTDGIKLMAETYGAFWLIDVILSYQTREWKKKNPPTEWPIQYWFLKKNPDDSCTVWMEYHEGVPEIKQEIEFTAFPEENFKLKYDAYSLVLCLYEED